MVFDHPPEITFSNGEFILIDRGVLLKALAWNFHVDWELDTSSEIEVASAFLAKLNLEEKKGLREELLAFMNAFLDDQQLTQQWVELGADGWLRKTNVREFLNRLLLEIEKEI